MVYKVLWCRMLPIKQGTPEPTPFLWDNCTGFFFCVLHNIQDQQLYVPPEWQSIMKCLKDKASEGHRCPDWDSKMKMALPSSIYPDDDGWKFNNSYQTTAWLVSLSIFSDPLSSESSRLSCLSRLSTSPPRLARHHWGSRKSTGLRRLIRSSTGEKKDRWPLIS